MSPKEVPPSDQMRVSGSGRRKVALPPGRSQLDWVRDSARFPYIRPRSIPLRELRAHNTREDAWIAVQGKVFDITSYAEYHPGGIDMILAGAGKDATNLFIKYHAWVNFDFMLKPCYLGTLDMRGASDDSGGEDSEDNENSIANDSAQVSRLSKRDASARSSSKSSRTSQVEDVNDDFDALRLAEVHE